MYEPRRSLVLANAVLACLVLAVCSTSTAQEVPAGDSRDPGAGRVVRAYVTNFGGDGVSVVDVSGGRRVGRIPTGAKPHGVVIAPDGRAVYVSNEGDGTLSVIDPGRNEVVATVEVGGLPNQVEVSADGRFVFVSSTISE